MRRSWKTLPILLSFMALALAVHGEDRQNSTNVFLDGKSAGADFQIQGEYIGKVDDQSFGVQVISRGGGQFAGVVFTGGLPGAGWNQVKMEQAAIAGATKDGTTTLSAEGFQATIANGTLVLAIKDKSGELKKLHRESPTLGMNAPNGALILFDGSNVDHWLPGKMEEANLMGVGTRTKQVFADHTLHLEFRTPYMPFETGQGRGNSGFYLGDQYECQILDSFGLEGADNECGGIYKNAKPKINMCLPPLSWQTYDVDFTCAKFDAEGTVTMPAIVTIKHNGVVIHSELKMQPTPGGGRMDQKPGSVFLQDHNDPVRFRNIWILEKK